MRSLLQLLTQTEPPQLLLMHEVSAESADLKHCPKPDLSIQVEESNTALRAAGKRPSVNIEKDVFMLFLFSKNEMSRRESKLSLFSSILYEHGDLGYPRHEYFSSLAAFIYHTREVSGPPDQDSYASCRPEARRALRSTKGRDITYTSNIIPLNQKNTAISRCGVWDVVR